MAVYVGHWWVFQYFWVPFRFVIVQFRTVFCPSVENIPVFCEALSVFNPAWWWYGLVLNWSDLSPAGKLSCCCSSQGCHLFLGTVLQSKSL